MPCFLQKTEKKRIQYIWHKAVVLKEPIVFTTAGSQSVNWEVDPLAKPKAEDELDLGTNMALQLKNKVLSDGKLLWTLPCRTIAKSAASHLGEATIRQEAVDPWTEHPLLDCLILGDKLALMKPFSPETIWGSCELVVKTQETLCHPGNWNEILLTWFDRKCCSARYTAFSSRMLICSKASFVDQQPPIPLWFHAPQSC